jgi:hypothetical protein
MALRGCGRRRKRSLAVIALLASASFLIIAVDANRLDARRLPRDRPSGTGGFALFGESSLPVLQDLNTKSGRDFFGLGDKPAFSVVPMRKRDGDEASCLNLNHAQSPRILGVSAGLLEERRSFTFAQTITPTSRPWSLLETNQAGNVVPAVADEATIVWALGKKVGDTLDCEDESGARFKILLVGSLANSILQGSLIIDEKRFIERFPGESGHRVFLIDAADSDAGAVTDCLGRALRDCGPELVPAARRLNAFNAVQNTYLDTFQALGGLGLLLGSAGLGAVALRNTLERRKEFAILLAAGFKPRTLRRLIVGEHAVLIFLGVAVGAASALVAVLPAVLWPGAELSWRSLGLFLALAPACGLFSAWVAARSALRGRIVEMMRDEG